MSEPKINLGDKVRDTITGVEGIVTSRTEFLNGCWRYAVQPRVGSDGKVPQAEWVDVMQLEVLEATGKPKTEGDRKTGGPMDYTPPTETAPTL